MAKRVRLGALFPGVSLNPSVIGIVIARQDAKEFSKDGQATDRWVLNFTLRDSPYDTANISCWGSYQFIQAVDEALQIGSIVAAVNVKLSPGGKANDLYRPNTTCGSNLSISENSGEVRICDPSDPLLGHGMYEALAQLAHVPNGLAPETLTVSDIKNGSERLSGTMGNLLVAVQKVGEERHFRTRDGRDVTKLDVKCFDQSGFNLLLLLWDKCYVNLAKTWTEFETVIFISDALLKWDNYRNSLIVQMSSRSVCTVQPKCEEAKYLHDYAKNASCFPEDAVDEPARFEPDFDTDLSKITQIMNIQQLKEAIPTIGNSRKLDAVLYCFFTDFDIDSDSGVPISATCNFCHTRIPDFRRGFFSCPIPECEGSRNDVNHNLKFDIRVTLSDSSGSLAGCRLLGVAAERSLGLTAEEFTYLSFAERTALKWQFLLERSRIYVSATLRKSNQSQADIWILFANQASLDEVATKCSAA